VNDCLRAHVSSRNPRGDNTEHPGYDFASNAFRFVEADETRRHTMISVVEWLLPIRNAAWVAACFGSLGA
jgi:hypothetical protein